MMSLLRFLAIACALMLAASAVEGAVIISTYDHSGNGFASGTGADAYVTENAANSNYGGAVEVQMRNQAGSMLQMPYYWPDVTTEIWANWGCGEM